MAQRPFITGIVAAGIAAVALHVGSAPAPSPPPSSSAHGYADNTHGKSLPKGQTDFDKLVWTDEMKNHPERTGKLAAEKELEEAIADFYTAPAKQTPAAPVVVAAAATPGTKSQPTPPPAPPAAPQPAARSESSGCDEDGTIEVMIAIEPDPIHTHLALTFDRDIDAIEDALQESGWQYQSNWLPWSPMRSPAGGDHFLDQEQQRLFLEGREQYPGVLLFRPDPPRSSAPVVVENVVDEVKDTKGKAATSSMVNPTSGRGRKKMAMANPVLMPVKVRTACHPLAIFVVGNSPTAGINRTQFDEALAQIKALAPDQARLRILGPSFSGAGSSLRKLLPEIPSQLPAVKQIDVASGTISDGTCSHMLPVVQTAKVGTPADQAKEDVPCASPDSAVPKVTFVSFGADGAWLTHQTEDFLNRRGGFAYEEMAELSEDESGYGWMANDRPTYARGNDPVVNKLYFPRNISHLRSAYQKSNIFGFGASAQGSGNISLNLDFDEANEDDDAVPNFAQQQMPVSQDGTMHQIADLIDQRHIKVVLLSATDVLDEIFVAEILARQSPDVLVVIPNTDDLFLRSGNDSVFHNMYFVSPWPLIPDSQLWSRSIENTSVFRSFPSDGTEGLHAAMRYLFRDPLVPDNYVDLTDYSSPLRSTNRPPLRLSAIGHGAFWPIALLDTPEEDKEDIAKNHRSAFNLPPIFQPEKLVGSIALLSTTSPPSFNASESDAKLKKMESRVGEMPPLSQRLLLVLLCLLSLTHVSSCLGLYPLESVSLRYRITHTLVRTRKLVLLLGITLVGMEMLTLSLSPGCLLWERGFYFSTITFTISALSLSLAAAHLLAQLFTPTDKEPYPDIPRPILTHVCLTVFFFACFFVLWNIVWPFLTFSDRPQSGLAEFFAYRASHPLSGVSPVFPLLLSFAGIVLLLLCQLGRLAFTSCTAPRLPSTDGGVPNCPTEKQLSPLYDLLCYPSTGKTWKARLPIIAAVGVAAAIVMSADRSAPNLFDGVPLHHLLDATMLVLVIAILWDLVMAAVLWQKLKALCLDRLEASSLRRGFSMISGLTWQSLWLPQNSHSLYRSIIRMLEQASRLTLDKEASTAQNDGDAADNISLKQAVEAMWTALKSPDTQAIVEAFARVQQKVAFVAGLLLVQLKEGWRDEEDRITAPDIMEAEEKSSPADFPVKPTKPLEPLQQLREEWVALVYIHYVRMVLIQIRSRLIAAAGLYLLLVWAGTSYPYLNRHILLIALSALLGILAFMVIYTYGSINRNAILSRATNHTPGHLDLDFYLKTASLVGIPLLGFIASQFPEVSSFLFSWVEPGVAAVK
jgi:hypothetical protein